MLRTTSQRRALKSQLFCFGQNLTTFSTEHADSQLKQTGDSDIEIIKKNIHREYQYMHKRPEDTMCICFQLNL